MCNTRTVKKNLLNALMAFYKHELTDLGQMLDPPVSKFYLSRLFKKLATEGGTNNPRVRRQIALIYDIAESVLFPEINPNTDKLPLLEEDRRMFLGRQGVEHDC